MHETISLSEGLALIQQAKQMIREVELLLPASPNRNFRERLVTHLESGTENIEFQNEAGILLRFYKEVFGVKDLLGEME